MVHVRRNDHVVFSCWDMDYTYRLVDPGSEFRASKSRRGLDRSDSSNGMLGSSFLCAGVSPQSAFHPKTKATDDTLTA